MVKMKGLPVLTVTLLLLAGTGAALYLSGMNFSGQLTATAGEEPGAIDYTWNVNITDDNNDTQLFEYDNTDGIMDMVFVMSNDLVSTDESCNFEPGKDIAFFVNDKKLDGNSPIITMQPGINNITINAVPDTARCPLEGNISVTGNLL